MSGSQAAVEATIGGVPILGRDTGCAQKADDQMRLVDTVALHRGKDAKRPFPGVHVKLVFDFPDEIEDVLRCFERGFSGQLLRLSHDPGIIGRSSAG